MTFKTLELFKGTGSFSKVASKMKMKNISLDNVEKFKPDILIDILKWDYKEFFKHYIPDFIWASPPCNTYSHLAYKLQERNIKTAEPLSTRAKLGTAILYKTLQIINYAKKLNPNLLFVIENPRGMMRFDKKIKKLHIALATYSAYGDQKYKPTNFFSNFPLELISDKIPINFKRVEDLPLEERYRMPPKLILEILKQMLSIHN
jgi:site-specific DNA-cytosine methylase